MDPNVINMIRTSYIIFLLFIGPLTPKGTNIAMPEICDNGVDDDLDGLVDGYDDDCCSFPSTIQFQMCPTDCPKDVSQAFSNIELKYSVQSNIWHEGTTPLVGDLDSDGCVDIVGFSAYIDPATDRVETREILVLDGRTGDEKVRFDLGRDGVFSSNLGMADTDRDGYGEVYYNFEKLERYDYDGTTFNLMWSVEGDRFSQPTITDFNEDGFPEILLANSIYDARTGTKLFDPPQGMNSGRTTSGSSSTAAAIDVMPAAFCPNCEGKELIVGNKVYSVLIDGLNVAEVNLESELPYNRDDGLVAIADFDLDGDLDAAIQQGILPASRVNKGVVIWDMQTSDTISTRYEWATRWTWVSPPSAGDVDGDGMPEIVLTDRFEIHCLSFVNGELIPLFVRTIDDETGISGSIMFDFDLDGDLEIVHRDQDSLRIYDGPQGEVVFSAECTSLTGYETPSVADIDGDGEAELLCSCDRSLKVFEPMTGSWPSVRAVWNQLMFRSVNVREDLTIPLVEQRSANLSGPSTYDVYLGAHALGHTRNINLTPVDYSRFCDGTEVRYVVEVCNQGQTGFCGELPFQVFSEDPSLSRTTALLSLTEGLSIPSGECALIEFSVSRSVDSVWLMVNDDGGQNTPYDLTQNLRYSYNQECFWEDNIISMVTIDSVTLPRLGRDTAYCDVLEVLLNPGTIGDRIWQDGSSSEVYIAFQTGWYWVEVSDSCLGRVRDSIYLTINDSLVLESEMSICEGDSIFLASEWRTTEGVYLEYFNSQGCDTITRTKLNVNPLQEVVLPDTLEVQYGESLILLDGSMDESGYDYEWVGSFDFSCRECLSTKLLIIKESGKLVLTYQNQLGCQAVKEVYLKVSKPIYNYFIPNAISPDGDNINEVFEILSDDSRAVIEQLMIYDRWGAMRYKLENVPLTDWEGWIDYEMNSGVYVFYIELRDGNEESLTFIQDVTLIR